MDRLAASGPPWRLLAERLARAAERAGRPPTPWLLALAFRDMPYARPGGQGDPAVVIGRWRGTCSGKHIALQAALQASGLPARLMMGRYRLTAAESWLPCPVRALLPPDGVWDVHNFLVADLGSGEGILDVTWPRQLAAAGFPVAGLTLPFGRTAVAVEEIREQPPGTAGDALKRRWLAELNGDGLGAREAAIEALIAFAAERTPDADPEALLAETLESAPAGL